MKKIFTLFVVALFSSALFADVSISVSPNVIDFGTVELNNGEAQPADFEVATLTYELAEYVYGVWVDTISAINPDCEFSIVSDSGWDYWYGGDGYSVPAETTVWASFYAIAAGDYSITYRFYTFEADWSTKVCSNDFTLKVKVVEKATGLENATDNKVQSSKELRNGKLIIRRNGESYSIDGKLTR